MKKEPKSMTYGHALTLVEGAFRSGNERKNVIQIN
jgi:hypothetical protein